MRTDRYVAAGIRAFVTEMLRALIVATIIGMTAAFIAGIGKRYQVEQYRYVKAKELSSGVFNLNIQHCKKHKWQCR